MNAVEISLANDNNVLACDAFVQISFFRQVIVQESDFGKLYVTKLEGKDIFLQLICLHKVRFDHVTTMMTLPASGLESHEWIQRWMELHPETTPDTMMCVYYFRKHK